MPFARTVQSHSGLETPSPSLAVFPESASQAVIAPNLYVYWLKGVQQMN